MKDKGLFAHIAIQMRTHPENVATESLKYILNKDDISYASLRKLLLLKMPDLPDKLRFESQVHGPNDSIHDLIGFDGNGKPRVIVEAKFWAGLTERQPVEYVKSLPENLTAALVFITPKMRINTIWPKLVERLHSAGIIDKRKMAENKMDISDDIPNVTIGQNHHMILLSWGAILSQMKNDANSRTMFDLSADIAQLSGLCETMDREGFMPFTDFVLGPEVGRAVKQLGDVVDDTVKCLVNKYGASTKGLSTGGSQGTYGRYFYLKGLSLFLFYSPEFWFKEECPVFLSFWGNQIDDQPELRRKLNQYAMEHDLKVIDMQKKPAIGIPIKLYAENEEVIMSLAEDVMNIVQSCSGEYDEER